mmetsp:Transcript_56526/g.157537  ORF Transcript_56526/g.157537 Transcript_56526/m.157537 type:complete len:220 (-) Transcript_56526:130-789(-)
MHRDAWRCPQLCQIFAHDIRVRLQWQPVLPLFHMPQTGHGQGSRNRLTAGVASRQRLVRHNADQCQHTYVNVLTLAVRSIEHDPDCPGRCWFRQGRAPFRLELVGLEAHQGMCDVEGFDRVASPNPTASKRLTAARSPVQRNMCQQHRKRILCNAQVNGVAKPRAAAMKWLQARLQYVFDAMRVFLHAAVVGEDAEDIVQNTQCRFNLVLVKPSSPDAP